MVRHDGGPSRLVLVDESSEDEMEVEMNATLGEEEMVDKELIQNEEGKLGYEDETNEEVEQNSEDEEVEQDNEIEEVERCIADEEVEEEDLACEREIIEDWTRGFSFSTGREPKFWDLQSEFKDIDLQIGDCFESIYVCRLVFRMYAIEKGFSFLPTRNVKTGFGAVCEAEGCSFYIWCGMLRSEHCLAVKKLRANHNCDPVHKNKAVSSKILAHRYLKYIQMHKKVNIDTFKGMILDDLGVDCSKKKLYRSIEQGRAIGRGDDGDQYAMLHKYAKKVIECNPGTTFTIVDDGNDPPRFLRLYLCYGAQKEGFNKGCRPLIGLDGAHMKGYYGGIMLSAVARDANDGMFPLAMALVEQENKETWRWFLTQLFDDFNNGQDKGWVFMSDKQKGLVDLFNNWIPNVEHRHCMRHMYENWYRKFKSSQLKKMLWMCAASTTGQEFEQRMVDVRAVNENAYNWLRDRPGRSWCKAFFTPRATSSCQTNNICESFNSWMLQGRDLPILSFCEFYRRKLMMWFSAKKELIKSHNHLCPRIVLKMHVLVKKARKCDATKSTRDLYEVSNKGDTFSVNIREKSCSCREWELSGIPCKHGVAALYKASCNPFKEVHFYYFVETFHKIYEGQINPVNGMKDVRVLLPGEVKLLPPHICKPPGRPRVRRRKSFMEKVVDNEGSSSKKKISRIGVVQTCRQCGNKGHNIRTCSAKDYGQNVQQKGKGKEKSNSKGTIYSITGDEAEITTKIGNKRVAAIAKVEKAKARKKRQTSTNTMDDEDIICGQILEKELELAKEMNHKMKEKYGNKGIAEFELEAQIWNETSEVRPFTLSTGGRATEDARVACSQPIRTTEPENEHPTLPSSSQL